MATMLLTDKLLHANYIPERDGGYSTYQPGLVVPPELRQVSFTTAPDVVLNRPFFQSNDYHTWYAPHPGKFLAGGAAGVTKLIIYSGERPDVNTITNLASFEAQKIISFSIPAWTSSRATTGLFVEPANQTNYDGLRAICGICPYLTPAIASGLASWFWFGICLTDTEAKVYNPSFSGNYNNLSGYQFITGSVGLLGSGEDLEIVDRNIVAGEQYKSFGFNFYIPSVNTIIE